MSGFAALVAPRGAGGIDGPEARALAEALRHRGTDGPSLWTDGPALMLQARLGGTAIGHNFGEDGPIRVAGDIRLDNAAALRRALGLPPDATQGACIAAAYARWGTDCCNRFEGDFAFALWDARAGLVLAARDLLGVRPLFYASDKDTLRLASEPDAIARQGLRAPREDALAAYLAGLTEAGSGTGHVGVERLAAGHRLVWQAGHTRIECHAEIGPGPGPEETEATFRAVFGRAVGDRLDHADRPAALLSGGLDSSAICAVAAQSRGQDTPLPTYSFVHGHFREIDESAYIDAVLDRAGGRLAPTRVEPRGHAPLDGLQDMMTLFGGPYEAPGLLKSMALYRRIAADGCDVVLNGHGGDEVVGHGLGRVSDLARRGRWLEAFALVPAYCRLTGADPVALSLALVARHGPTHRGRQALRAIGRRVVQQQPPLWRRCLRPEVARRAGIDERMAAQGVGGDEPAQHLATLQAPLVGRALDLLDRATAHAGIEARYPFFDTRLVRLCLSLPSSERLRRDGSRSILRRALGDVLPKAVRDRPGKTRFGPELAVGLARHHGDVLERMVSPRESLLAGHLDLAVLRGGIEDLRARPKTAGAAHAMFLWRAAAVQLWLEMQTGRAGLAA